MIERSPTEERDKPATGFVLWSFFSLNGAFFLASQYAGATTRDRIYIDDSTHIVGRGRLFA